MASVCGESLRCKGLAAVKRLRLPPTRMQHGLCVAVWLFASLNDQLECGLKGNADVEARRHIAVGRVACVLRVNYRSHFLERGVHLRLCAYTPKQHP